MCGIAGSVGPSSTHDRGSIERQLRTVGHRGPDSSGVYARPGALVGQTRLAIIDLVTGDPPITSEDGSVGVALNGEIYNYKALGAELRRDGHKLATRGDTEVIAHLAEHLGAVEVARRLDGMFAFAVWNDAARRLTLGRDRVGKKPLYYWATADDLVFGSEIKAVLAHPLVSRELDPEAVPAYLTFGYVPTPRSFFAGIRSVPPGHVLTFEPGRGAQLERYWEPQVAGVGGVTALDLSFDDAATEVRSQLISAVGRRMVADVPLGAFLSGGIDSSAIVGILAGLSPRPVRTFTIGFEDTDGFDERPFARQVSERFGTEHVEFVVRPNAVDVIERLIWHHDQPFGDSSALPTFLLSELTRGHVTVALSGDGGDELFAGYERFPAALVLERLQRLPVRGRDALSHGAALIPPGVMGGRIGKLRRFVARSGQPVGDAFLAWVSLLPEEWRQELLAAPSQWAREDYRRIWGESEGADLLDRLLVLTIRTYLLDDLLPKADRMSMAHGLETRSPFLDHRLVQFALRLPRSARVRGMSTKRVLKHAVKDLLPPDIVNRRKRGFAVPLERWFKSDLRSFLEGTVGSPTARLRSHVDGGSLDRMLEEHRTGRANHRDAIWAMLTLELFLRREGW